MNLNKIRWTLSGTSAAIALAFILPISIPSGCKLRPAQDMRGQNPQKTKDPEEPIPNILPPETTNSADQQTSIHKVAPPCMRSVLGTTNSDDLNEISGIDVSANNNDLLYAHNDSGDAPRIYTLNLQAQLQQTIPISNATAVDWEDLSIGPCGNESCLFIADFGNNNGDRTTFQLYRIPETELATPPVTATTINFRYPDGGAYNAEFVAVSPKDGSIYVVRKTRDAANTLYRFPEDLTGTVNLIEVCTFTDIGNEQVTGGDIHHSGEKIMIRTYDFIYEYHSIDLADGKVCNTQIRKMAHAEPQGEALAYLNKSHSFYTISEETEQPLFLFRCELPE